MGIGFFLERDFFWNTDWRDGTRIFFACGVRDFGTRIGRIRHGFFSPAAFLDFIERVDLPYVCWSKSLTWIQYHGVSDAIARRKTQTNTRQRRVDIGYKSGDLYQLSGLICPVLLVQVSDLDPISLRR